MRVTVRHTPRTTALAFGAPLLDTCFRLLFFEEKKQRGKKEAWLTVVNMRPRKPGQSSPPNLVEKKNTALVAKMQVDYISS